MWSELSELPAGLMSQNTLALSYTRYNSDLNLFFRFQSPTYRGCCTWYLWISFWWIHDVVGCLFWH